MQKTLAIVVLYHPEKETEAIIASFKNQVDTVMIVDNSTNNIGVAAALNQGLQRAIDDGYDWLLTMDQDSVFEDGALKLLKDFAFHCNENIAIVSPFHFIKKTPRRSDIQEVPFTMTSGNLLRVSSAKLAGMFEEKLFIDSVDNEYCLRLRKHGFKIVRVNSSILRHQLGIQNVSHFNTITHPATRRYYITRNMLYVMKTYFPRFFIFGSKEIIKSLLLILMIEDDKLKKTRAMLKGAAHFAKGRFGPLD